MSSDERPTDWRAAALAVSLLLHGAGAWWVLSRPPPRPAEQPPTLVLFEVPPDPTPTPPPRPEPEPPAPEKPAPAPRPVKRAAPGPVAVAPPVAVEAPGPAVVEAPADLPRADVPRVTSLTTLSSDFALRIDAGVLPDEPVMGLRAPEISKDILGDASRASIGRGKVQRGLVHPYYSQLGKALLKQWDADRAVSKNGLKAYAEQFAENSKVWNNIWQSRAEQFAKTGSPVDSDQLGGGRPRPITGAPTGIGAEMQARKDIGRAMNEQFKSSRRAEIRVVQRRDGTLAKVDLIKPSNDSWVDQQALVDVRAAAEKLPAPPDEVIGTREQLESLWEFELIISITPPIPTFTFEFDEALGFVDARLPLDRRIYKHVKLLSVD